MRQWFKQAERDAGTRDDGGLSTSEREELAAPRREDRRLREAAATAGIDLIRRDFTADAAAINSHWCGDITYIATWGGWLYLATVIDIASRRVVGGSPSPSTYVPSWSPTR